jgi:hypothetical protein
MDLSIDARVVLVTPIGVMPPIHVFIKQLRQA